MTNIDMNSLLQSPLGRKLIKDAENYLSDLKAAKNQKKEELSRLQNRYANYTMGRPEHRMTQIFEIVEGVPTVVETNQEGRVSQITPLSEFGEVDPLLADQIKSKDEVIYRRLRNNDLQSVSRSDEYYKAEVYGEGQPFEIFEAYVKRPSNDPDSPRYSKDWWANYEGMEDYDAGNSKYLKVLSEDYSLENVREIASKIRKVEGEIEAIDAQIY